MWFLGNGELYEMMIPDLQKLAVSSGMSILAFNYRGVSHSTGNLVQAWDLVEDGRVCLDHLVVTMGADPEHVLLFGHSIGGAIAAQLRADHSPTGPLVVDRSFSTLGKAASSVFGILCKSILGFELKVPVFMVIGIMNACFKGRMNAFRAWKTITGPRLVIYHLEDAVIQYEKASLHYALEKDGYLDGTPQRGDAIRLGLDGEAGQNNHHNLPLERFPEFQTILSKCRRMVNLAASAGVDLADLSMGGSMDSTHGHMASHMVGSHDFEGQHAHGGTGHSHGSASGSSSSRGSHGKYPPQGGGSRARAESREGKRK